MIDFFSMNTKYDFTIDRKYEYQTKLSSGVRIIVKDTNLTLRTSQCNKCPIYCQEGFYTIRVATDGTLSTCIDYKNQLSFIDGPLELNKGSLTAKVREMVEMFEKAELKKTLNEFFHRYNIKLEK